MAVYTVVSFDEVESLVDRLDIGTLTALQPCAGGIENTNYFVDTSSGRFVLTLFERLSAEELPFYLQLMKHLADRGIPVPGPHADARGVILHPIKGKPAAMVDRLPGKHPMQAGRRHCASVGNMLARMHGAGQDFALYQPNFRGLAWWQESLPLVLPFVSDAQGALLQGELQFQQELAGTAAHAGLPRGPIHADLFRDNTMFEGERLTGMFDFYFAGVDSLLFDIAVCLNDWCIEQSSGALDETRAAAFVAAYDGQRRLSDTELQLLPAASRAAALRFWLSRLRDLHLPRDASLLTAHEPAHFERVLRDRIARPWTYTRPPHS